MGGLGIKSERREPSSGHRAIAAVDGAPQLMERQLNCVRCFSGFLCVHTRELHKENNNKIFQRI